MVWRYRQLLYRFPIYGSRGRSPQACEKSHRARALARQGIPANAHHAEQGQQQWVGNIHPHRLPDQESAQQAEPRQVQRCTGWAEPRILQDVMDVRAVGEER